MKQILGSIRTDVLIKQYFVAIAIAALFSFTTYSAEQFTVGAGVFFIVNAILYPYVSVMWQDKFGDSKIRTLAEKIGRIIMLWMSSIIIAPFAFRYLYKRSR